MDNRAESREFLSTRRAKISPAQAGLTSAGRNRRVAGLRREEVAILAGVSVDYYTRLERNGLAGVSEGVLDGVAHALQLSEAERDHLFDLARAANRSAARRSASSPQRVRPGIQRMLDVINAPAVVRNGRLDFLATNALGFALYAELFEEPIRPVNNARFVFLNARARDYYPDWETVASDAVSALRVEAGRDPYDRGLTDLVGELSTRSDEFRRRWATHDVAFHRAGSKRIRHSDVGELELFYEALEIPGEPGLRLTTYTAEPGSPSQDALVLLASWAATVRPQALPEPRITR